MTASGLLRPGLLDGVVVTVASPAPAEGVAAELTRVCEAVSAMVEPLAWDRGDGRSSATAVAAILERHGSIGTLVNDAGGAYRAALAAGGHGEDALRSALDGSWNATRSVANGAFIGGPGGKVIHLCPPTDAGPLAGATAAALENMARTLSIEWARYGIRICAIVPAADVPPAQIAQLAAFLASMAGDYYSGCRFDLGAPPDRVSPRPRTP